MYPLFFTLRAIVWERDWFIGVSIALILLSLIPLLQPVQQMVSIWNMTMLSPKITEPEVAVIAIDEASKAQWGEQFQSRALLSQWLDLLAPQTQTLGILINLTQPEVVMTPAAIDELMTFCLNSPLYRTAPAQIAQLDKFMDAANQVRAKTVTEQAVLSQLYKFYNSLNLSNTLAQELTSIIDRLQTAMNDVEGDLQFAQSLKKSANVILIAPSFTSAQVDESQDLPNFLSNHSFAIHNFAVSLPVTQIVAPLPKFVENAGAVGTLPEPIHSYRVPLLTNTGKHLSATVALLLVMKQWGVESASLQFLPNKGLQIGHKVIEIDEDFSIMPFFHPKQLSVDSFADVMTHRIAPERYKNKVVLLGMHDDPALMMTAFTVASLLQHDFFITPWWLWAVQIILFLLILTHVCWILPHLSFRLAWLSSGALLLSLWLLSLNFMHSRYLMAELYPMLLILLTHFSLLFKRKILAYQNIFHSRPSAVESNRLLGLAFQGQGQLDMAFEKFRLCPTTPATLTLLYNLSLDYELKCNYAGAAMVYRYILARHSFRDVEQRLERLRTLKKSSSAQSLGDWLLDGSAEKPYLGRYQIERQLGKGAMGIVYLGKDSKLDRLVAIKTLALSHEFELEGLAEATARFFREANAAGRLRHPDIITIYDAGEQFDLAYIAMEFFKGGNLAPYTKRDNLLPIATVLHIGIRVAEALDYAQKQGVVHRDIKPANIMYNPATEQIKITDFGIAYITDANKTKTGVILGTPSYMSPEQFAGKLPDGCSDLFSLGVTLFQLLTGQLPFQGNSMANLMYKITHEPPLDILRIRYEISPRLKQIMERALEKDPRKRFQQGVEFAQALRDCQDEI